MRGKGTILPGLMWDAIRDLPLAIGFADAAGYNDALNVDPLRIAARLLKLQAESR